MKRLPWTDILIYAAVIVLSLAGLFLISLATPELLNVRAVYQGF